MVLLTSASSAATASYRSPRRSSYVGRTSNDVPRRHVASGKFERITGHASYSPSASVRGLSPGVATSAAASTDLRDSEQYFRKMYPHYFSGGGSRVMPSATATRATSVGRTTGPYLSAYGGLRASSVTREPSGGGGARYVTPTRPPRAASVSRDLDVGRRASSVSRDVDRARRASSLVRAPPGDVRANRIGSLAAATSVGNASCLSSAAAAAAAATRLAPPGGSYGAGQRGGDELLRKARAIRASSLSRFPVADDDDDNDADVRRLVSRAARATSVTRTTDYDDDAAATPSVIYAPRDRSADRVGRAASISRFSDYDRETVAPVAHGRARTDYGVRADYGVQADYGVVQAGRGVDIATYVLPPGQAFEPDDVEVSTLPSGERVVTYTQTSQTAAGDGRTDAAIDRIIAGTQDMYATADSLERYVRQRRHLFPDDTLVIQHISYYRLRGEELRRAGEREGAEVYGMRLRERLIVPHGTDATRLLAGFTHTDDDVQVEFRSSDAIRLAASEGLDAECDAAHDGRRSRFIGRAPSIDDDLPSRVSRDAPYVSRYQRRASVDPPETALRYRRHASVDTAYVPRFQRRASVDTAYVPRGQRHASVDTAYVPRSQRHASVDTAYVPRSQRHTSVDTAYVPRGQRRASVDLPETSRYQRHAPADASYVTRGQRHASVESLPAGRRRSISPPTTPPRRIDKYGHRAAPRSRQSSVCSVRSDVDAHRSSYVPPSPRSAAPPGGWRTQRDDALRFTAPLEPKRCRQGQSVRLGCIVDGVGKVKVMWSKGQQPISDCSRYTFSNRRGVVSLEIQDVCADDAGLYTVQASRGDVDAVCSADLQVREKSLSPEAVDATERPKFLSELTNQSVTLGDKLVLTVKVNGRPLPSIKWHRDNISVVDDARTKLTADERGNVRLQISAVSEADLGLYVCSATSRAGTARCSAAVRALDGEFKGNAPLVNGEDMSRDTSLMNGVEARETVRSFDFSAVADDGGVKPQGTKPWFLQPIPTEVSVHQGEPLTLQCVLDGVPKPVVTWYKGVRELTYGRRHRVVVENDHHMLQVISTLQTDCGQYVVEAENRVGKVRVNCWVNLLPPRSADDDDDSTIKRARMTLPDFDYSVRTAGEKALSAPHFVKKLPFEKEIVEGATLELECRVGEMETSEVITDVDLKVESAPVENGLEANELLENGPGPEQAAESSSGPEETAPQSGPEPDGASSGPVLDAAPVESVDIQLNSQSVETASAANDLESSQVVEETIGAQAASVDEATPTIVIDSAEEKLLCTDESGEVAVESDVGDVANQSSDFVINSDVSGEIVVVVAESVSEVAVDVQLEATPGGGGAQQNASEEVALAMTLTGEQTAAASGAERDSVQVEASAESSTTLVVSSAEVEGRTTTTTTEAAEETLTVSAIEIVQSDAAIDFTATSSEVVLEEQIVVREAVGPAVVEGSGAEGGDGGQAPGFSVALDSVRVVAGETARLVVTVTGRPQPHVEWQKDDADIPEAERKEIFADDNSFHLEISKAIVEDSGVYSCRASNEHGFAACSCVLVVQDDEPVVAVMDGGVGGTREATPGGIPEATPGGTPGGAPGFREPICDCVVTDGADAQFDCRVTGDPAPEVNWSKGGRALTPSKKVRMSCEDGVHLLVIAGVHKSDEGGYECGVKSEGGAATCAATLTVRMPSTKTVESSSSDSESSDSSDSDSSSDTDSSDDSSSDSSA